MCEVTNRLIASYTSKESKITPTHEILSYEYKVGIAKTVKCVITNVFSSFLASIE